MNDKIIENWNSVITQNDIVYHLGDFSFGRDDYLFDSIINRLNGYIILIEGNHDSLARRNRNKFYGYYYGYYEVTIENQDIVMSHYPMVVWNKKHHGSWMLCGHTHYNLPVTRKESNILGKILDVGVDGNNYKPYSFNDLKQIMDTKDKFSIDDSYNDHHTK